MSREFIIVLLGGMAFVLGAAAKFPDRGPVVSIGNRPAKRSGSPRSGPPSLPGFGNG